MQRHVKYILCLTIIVLSSHTLAYRRKITQLNVPSYEDVTDQYRKLQKRMFAGKNYVLVQPITVQQLDSWQEFINFLKLYSGQQLANRYISGQKVLKKALDLPFILQRQVDALRKAGLGYRDVMQLNPTLKKTRALYDLLQQENTDPAWIQQEIITPLQDMVIELKQQGATEHTAEAALMLIANGLILNWSTVAEDFGRLRELYGALSE